MPWVRELVQRDNRQGLAGIGDRRHAHPGQSGLLSQEQQAEWAQALEGPSPDGGRWSGPQVAGWMSQRLGRTVWPPQGGVSLRRLGFTPHRPRPRPRHAKAEGPAQDACKGGAFAAAVGAVRQAHPDDQRERWGSDEHRVGLKPIRRGVWARRGPRVVAAVHPRCQWTSLYGFVRPRSGQTWWLLLPTVPVRADRFSLALAQFAHAVGAGQGKQVLVLLDRAGWHLSDQVQVPDGLQLVWLPPSSPESQPAERVWPLADQPLVNQTFSDLDALEAALIQRCRALQPQPARIQAATLFHWWPKTA